MDIKIGILLPRSDMFPTLAKDFLNGLKLHLKGQEDHLNTSLIFEGIGNASNDSVLRSAEKLILQEEVDLVISFCSNSILKEFVKLFETYKTPLIHVDLGGNVLKKEHSNPYVIHHTLNVWQTSYEMGKYAARNKGKKAALAISFYDGGYHLTDAFVKGFTEEGGKVIFNYVSPMDYKEETFDSMIQGILNSEPDFIFCLFSYKEGNKVFERLSDSEINGKIPMITIPLMTDEAINTENYNIKEVSSIASWAFDEELPEMIKFNSDYKEAYQNSPNIISLLGYEIGLTISNCLDEDGKIPSEISNTTKNLNIITPRGKLIYNAYHESEVSTFKLRDFNYNETKYHNTVVETIESSISENTYQKFEDHPASGWKNPYICT